MCIVAQKKKTHNRIVVLNYLFFLRQYSLIYWVSEFYFYCNEQIYLTYPKVNCMGLPSQANKINNCLDQKRPINYKKWGQKLEFREFRKWKPMILGVPFLLCPLLWWALKNVTFFISKQCEIQRPIWNSIKTIIKVLMSRNSIHEVFFWRCYISYSFIHI